MRDHNETQGPIPGALSNGTASIGFGRGLSGSNTTSGTMANSSSTASDNRGKRGTMYHGGASMGLARDAGVSDTDSASVSGVDNK